MNKTQSFFPFQGNPIRGKPRLWLSLLALCFLAAILSAGYFFYKYRETKNLLAQQPLSPSESKSAIIRKVAALIDVPTNEEPTVATVRDIGQLEDQPFFAKAKNGDYLLIYQTARKAFLYDPLANKILEVGPLASPAETPVQAYQSNQQVLSEPAATPASTAAATTPLAPSPTPTLAPQRTIILSNGTGISGLTYIIEQKLAVFGDEYRVVRKTQAAKRDYTKTLIIPLTGKQDQANLLASRLDGEVTTLPKEEEQPSDADFLVIIGILTIE